MLENINQRQLHTAIPLHPVGQYHGFERVSSQFEKVRIRVDEGRLQSQHFRPDRLQPLIDGFCRLRVFIASFDSRLR